MAPTVSSAYPSPRLGRVDSHGFDRALATVSEALHGPNSHQLRLAVLTYTLTWVGGRNYLTR
jgi:hypothetical protein